MKEFVFEVKLIAQVRVSALDESSARRVVPSVLGAPGLAEITLVNQGNEILWDTVVTAVDFSVDKEIRLVSSKGGARGTPTGIQNGRGPRPKDRRSCVRRSLVVGTHPERDLHFE